MNVIKYWVDYDYNVVVGMMEEVCKFVMKVLCSFDFIECG